jgi:tetrahydromethanopterin S-methyltransferase subunit B
MTDTIIVDEASLMKRMQEREHEARRMQELFDPLLDTLRVFAVRHGISENTLTDGLIGMVLGRFLGTDWNVDRATAEVREAFERMCIAKGILDEKTH